MEKFVLIPLAIVACLFVLGCLIEFIADCCGLTD